MSVVGLDEPYYHVEGSGLSGTVRAQQTDYLPLIDVDGHLIDDGARLIIFDESGGSKASNFFKNFSNKVSTNIKKKFYLYVAKEWLGIIVRSFRVVLYRNVRFGVVLFLGDA